jgi:hypothetical protein
MSRRLQRELTALEKERVTAHMHHLSKEQRTAKEGLAADKHGLPRMSDMAESRLWAAMYASTDLSLSASLGTDISY